MFDILHIQLCVCMCVWVCVWVFVCLVCLYVCVCVRLCAYVRVCVYVRVCLACEFSWQCGPSFEFIHQHVCHSQLRGSVFSSHSPSDIKRFAMFEPRPCAAACQHRGYRFSGISDHLNCNCLQARDKLYLDELLQPAWVWVLSLAGMFCCCKAGDAFGNRFAMWWRQRHLCEWPRVR